MIKQNSKTLDSNFMKFGVKIFCLGDQGSKKSNLNNFSKSADFCIRDFSGMWNTNPKEFFNFDRR